MVEEQPAASSRSLVDVSRVVGGAELSIERKRAFRSRRFLYSEVDERESDGRKWIGNPVQLLYTNDTETERFVENRRKRERLFPFLSFSPVRFTSRWKRAFLAATRHAPLFAFFLRATEEKKDEMEKERYERGQQDITSWTDNRCDYSQDVH